MTHCINGIAFYNWCVHVVYHCIFVALILVVKSDKCYINCIIRIHEHCWTWMLHNKVVNLVFLILAPGNVDRFFNIVIPLKWCIPKKRSVSYYLPKACPIVYFDITKQWYIEYLAEKGENDLSAAIFPKFLLLIWPWPFRLQVVRGEWY